MDAMGILYLEAKRFRTWETQHFDRVQPSGNFRGVVFSPDFILFFSFSSKQKTLYRFDARFFESLVSCGKVMKKSKYVLNSTHAPKKSCEVSGSYIYIYTYIYIYMYSIASQTFSNSFCICIFWYTL